MSGYLNMFIFRQLRMTFHKIMVAEKKFFFLQIHNTILQRIKQFLNVNMINLEETK